MYLKPRYIFKFYCVHDHSGSFYHNTCYL